MEPAECVRRPMLGSRSCAAGAMGWTDSNSANGSADKLIHVLHSFPGIAVTNGHEPGGLRQEEFILIQF